LDFVSAHTIRPDIGGSRNDEFAGSWYPTGAANPGVRCKQIDGAPDPQDGLERSGRVILRNVFELFTQVD